MSLPGVIAAAATPFLLPRDKASFAELINLDRRSLVLMAIALASLEIGLKQAPHDGWLSPLCSLLFSLSAVGDGWICRQNLEGARIPWSS